MVHITVQVQLDILGYFFLLLVQSLSRIVTSRVVDYVKWVDPFKIGAPFISIKEFTQLFFSDINFGCFLLSKSVSSVSSISQEV